MTSDTLYSFAPVYDFLLWPYIRKIRRSVADLVKDHGFKEVLDVACGTGNQLKYLRNNGVTAVGIDQSDHMLKKAGSGSQPVRCFRQDATNMEFDDGTFDLATITLTLHETNPSNALKIISEMMRVTRPGGKLLVIDYEISSRTSRFSHSIVRMVEGFAGGEHFENFKMYVENGGIDGLIRQNSLHVEFEKVFRNHGLVMKLLGKG